eukprot:GDKK01031655.1.p1 GENE.GDKK01031655.1~~GDKK01031655.1.p1  ORF type:complete len:116 (+),score=0.04 GDKK01031655.1:2-349(+)
MGILLSKEVAHVVAFDVDENIIFTHKVTREIPQDPVSPRASADEQRAAAASSRLTELRGNGIDPADPMWLPIGSKCDRFRLRKSFINGTHWDRDHSSGCYMYMKVGEKDEATAIP